ncbi:phage tail fiber protein [Enterobacillus tribolii]|uniref:Tail fiber protein gp37 n=1 Tax=Enterobacillus tribolii TaxID=1487935 RepID=A0A370R2R3_9GAMM|nr:prophage tail fiber N-terminal domain-containing protein [Enterobacillus tribolii]MBW7984731.1 hypothetical protein [Enterobacillus tribolii]RDK96731.1 tail fiber protein gp37 [Enterobacillus tribolii]
MPSIILSGTLIGPVGNIRANCTIMLVAVDTSVSVIVRAYSETVTDAAGKYKLTVEPGEYSVITIEQGGPPERVGKIKVLSDSIPGTLNDFLNPMGEEELTPADILKLEQLRNEAQAASASAKSDAASIKAVKDNMADKTLNLSDLTDKSAAIQNLGLSERITTKKVVVNGALDVSKKENAITLIAPTKGSAYYILGKDIDPEAGTETNDWYLGRGSSLNSDVTLQSYTHNTYLILRADRVDINRDIYSRGVPLIKTGDYGIGGYSIGSDWDKAFTDNKNTFICSSINSPSGSVFMGLNIAHYQDIPYGFQIASRGSFGLYFRTKEDGTVGAWRKVWDDKNTTVDSNGFIKKASPIVRLSNDPHAMSDDYLDGFTLSTGVGAVNDEAAGVVAKRKRKGVYIVSGSLGLAVEGWTFEVPQDQNGNRLCFVETETAEDGTITVTVSKRKLDLDTAMVVAGDPMDIPAGRWVDLRLEMPPQPEPEPIPEPVETLLTGDEDGTTAHEGEPEPVETLPAGDGDAVQSVEQVEPQPAGNDAPPAEEAEPQETQK